MTLKQAIKAAKLDWVNTDIEENFSYGEPRNADYKLFHFDNLIAFDEVVKEIEKEGYSPATLSELLAYAKDGWNGEDWIVALGSSAQFGLIRHVVCLRRNGAGRGVNLLYWGGDWNSADRLLGVRNMALGASSVSPSPSATLSLEAHVTRLEEVMKEVGHQIGEAVRKLGEL